jgi:hypothetical protein
MIKENELRIGNYVNYEQTTHIITCVNIDYSISVWIDKNNKEHLYHHKNNELKPISLTEEWLLRFGAEYSHKVLDIKMYQLGLYFIAIRKEGFRFIKKSTNTGAYEPLKDLYFAHELQNIYHDLTNEELKLKP